MKQHLFLGCDWGTSSFRLHLAEAESGRSIAEIRDSEGIRKIHLDLEKSESMEDRTTHMRTFLSRKVNLLAGKTDQDLNGLPIILSGMASSNMGLMELPYSTLPLSLERPELITRTFKPDRNLDHPLLLISGVREKRDVMRGEEVQLLGLSLKHRMDHHIGIMPGTHSKHLFVKKNHLLSYKTYMTGELFEVIRTHTILSDSVRTAAISDTDGRNAFTEGVSRAQEENLLHSLFTIRGSQILDKSDRGDNFLHLSGLLLGTELKELDNTEAAILLAGAGELQSLYALALDTIGLSYTREDDTGELTLLGQSQCLDYLRA